MSSFVGYLKLLPVIAMFASTPTSTNFTLQSYEITTGGNTSTSTNFGLQSATGAQTGGGSSTNFRLLDGYLGTQQADVPPAPVFTNPSNEYNRLRLVVSTGSNPTDTLYQIAISTDNFATTQYIQTDNTIGSSNTLAQYQTYSAWGGASGVWITGLASSTTYQVRVRALQGDFTGSAFSPIVSAATVSPSLTFSVATSLTPTPPYGIGFSSLTAGSVVNGSASAEIGLTTNAVNGGVVYVRSNGALTSSLAATSIASATTDLNVAASGYGAQVSTTNQSSGGPLSAVSPFNGTAQNVGALTTSLQRILETNNPITSGTSSVILKAKVTASTPAATDYTDTVTFIAAMLY